MMTADVVLERFRSRVRASAVRAGSGWDTVCLRATEYR